MISVIMNDELSAWLFKKLVSSKKRLSFSADIIFAKLCYVDELAKKIHTLRVQKGICDKVTQMHRRR